jgi:hypothetical protein
LKWKFSEQFSFSLFSAVELGKLHGKQMDFSTKFSAKFFSGENLKSMGYLKLPTLQVTGKVTQLNIQKNCF